MNLYYLSGTNEEGEDFSLHVVAPNMFQAHAMWKEHWEATFFLASPSHGSPNAKVEDKLLIYEIVYEPDTAGVVEWGRDAMIVGYVE
jgi:hypothetical protein